MLDTNATTFSTFLDDYISHLKAQRLDARTLYCNTHNVSVKESSVVEAHALSLRIEQLEATALAVRCPVSV